MNAHPLWITWFLNGNVDERFDRAGTASNFARVKYPLPVPPPQGGRERKMADRAKTDSDRRAREQLALVNPTRRMSISLLFVQILNGLQLGVLLFLIAAGLTLVFGVMNFINLAHGVQYMLGAYLAVMFYGLTDNFALALILALASALVLGLLLEF